jgi:hypothetical protein
MEKSSRRRFLESKSRPALEIEAYRSRADTLSRSPRPAFKIEV